MLGRLILLIAFLLAVVTISQLLKNTPKSQRKNAYWKIGLSALGIVLVLLAVTGRIPIIGAIFGALLPFVRLVIPLLLRYLPDIQRHIRTRPQQTSAASNTSEVETRILKMVLDHTTEQLRGEVIGGPLAGNNLDSLELSQLQQLLDYCHREDKDSVKLLMTYLSHRFGHDWQKSSPSYDGSLTEESALAILGLTRGASRDDIIQAHRRMMQKMHPDRGGSDYLAAQINQAKDFLIGNRA